jgi:hypothetical protein
MLFETAGAFTQIDVPAVFPPLPTASMNWPDREDFTDSSRAVAGSAEFVICLTLAFFDMASAAFL